MTVEATTERIYQYYVPVHRQAEPKQRRVALTLRTQQATQEARLFRIEWCWDAAEPQYRRWWTGDVDDVLDLRTTLECNGCLVLEVQKLG